jgi:CBS domain-containing protein
MHKRYDIGRALNRGPLEFKTKLAEHEGSIMSLANREVVTIPPTMSIKGAADTMTRYRFRRLPVTDPGTNRLLGIIGSMDIIDFLGGGEKYQIIKKKYKGNFLAAINESVREIMVTDVLALETTATIKDALDLILGSRVGGLVIVNGENRVEGIVTERDFVFLLVEKVTGKKAEDYMTKRVVTASSRTTLGDAARIMVRNSFRRLPVVKEGSLVGMVTTRTIIEFIGRNDVFAKIVENRVDEVLKILVEEIMKREVSTVTKDRDLGEIAKIIEETGAGTVCIVENGRLIGILTERDIVRAMCE